MHTDRYRRWVEQIEPRRLDGFLTTHPPNLRYLHGFSGSAGAALFLEGESHLIVDGRYIEQAGAEAQNARAILAEGPWQESLVSLLTGRARIGFESRHLSAFAIDGLRRQFPDLEWVSTSRLTESLRMIKDAGEIGLLEQAFDLAQRAYTRFSRQLCEGMSELEAAALLELEMRREGAEEVAFGTIVAAAERSSLPHARPGSRLLARGEMVLVDFGVRHHGYCSDLTRMLAMPGASPPSITEVVREAQEAALDQVRPGVSSARVDEAARRVISEHGYEHAFKHGTGHGLGLEVHELPAVSSREAVELQEGMTFTIEPGIYLEGRCGVRLEDAVVVTATGHRLLSDRDR